MASAAKKTFITPEEYLAREHSAESKSEYYDGEIYAMAGTSFRHNRIVGNLLFEIRSQLGERDCQVCFSDVRLRTEAADAYTYPDIMVICGQPLFAENEFDTLLNPVVIIEVLSPSTELWDRGGKFEKYRNLESLREYVLVSQKKVLVERYTRQDDEWVLKTWKSEDDVVSLASIDCNVILRDIYSNVSFDLGA